MNFIITEELVNRLQCISFVFELIGFLLVVIELFRPKLADLIEIKIDSLTYKNVFIKLKKGLHYQMYESGEKENQFIILCVVLLLPLIFVFSIMYGLTKKFGIDILPISHFSDTPEWYGVLLLPVFIILFIIILFIGYALWLALFSIISLFFSFITNILNQLSGGRALGTFGLILSGIGFSIEFLQVISIKQSFIAYYGIISLVLFLLVVLCRKKYR